MCDNFLLDDSWSPIFAVDDVNICTEAFTLVLKHILDTLVPLRRLRMKRTSAPWNHSQEIFLISARQRRNWLHCMAMKSGDSSDWST